MRVYAGPLETWGSKKYTASPVGSRKRYKVWCGAGWSTVAALCVKRGETLRIWEEKDVRDDVLREQARKGAGEKKRMTEGRGPWEGSCGGLAGRPKFLDRQEPKATGGSPLTGYERAVR